MKRVAVQTRQLTLVLSRIVNVHNHCPVRRKQFTEPEMMIPKNTPVSDVREVSIDSTVVLFPCTVCKKEKRPSYSN